MSLKRSLTVLCWIIMFQYVSSQDYVREAQDYVGGSQDYVGGSQDYVRESQDYIRGAQDSVPDTDYYVDETEPKEEVTAQTFPSFPAVMTTPVYLPINQPNLQQVPHVHSSENLRKICGISNALQTRIVGGTPAALNAWPWMAAIFVNGKLDYVSCGGVLITDEFVLTAAHCFRKPKTTILWMEKDVTIRLGDLDISRSDDGANPLDFNVYRLISHSQYDPKIVANDIGLIQLDGSVPFTQSILPICLPDTQEMINQTFYSMHPYIAGGKASESLRQVSVRVTKNWKCQAIFERFKLPITDKQLCAGYNLGGRDACQGDSGGPLMMVDSKNQMTVIGVISVGYKCAEPGFPGIYTKVSSYLPWIKQYVLFEK